MKKLNNLLARLENMADTESTEITNLNALTAQKIKGGILDITTNGGCDGTNSSCKNDLCQGSSNGSCANTTCIE